MYRNILIIMVMHNNNCYINNCIYFIKIVC